MASYTFDGVKLKVAKGEMIFFGVSDGDFKMALVTSGVFENQSTGAMSDSTVWDDVSACEITENVNYNTVGYTGPVDLTNVGTLEEDVNGFTQLKVSAIDVSYPVSQIDADGAVVYKNDASKTLVEAIHFGSKISSNNGVFNVNISNNGWIRIH
tara:strand:- start:39256 stop:39717 length:462 start_codon:yes stop_codon:yes gene_type:complete